MFPFTARTTIWFVPGSRSFTRRRAHSSQAQARAIARERHEPRNPMDLAEDGADLLASQHDRQVVRALGIGEIVQPRDLLQQDTTSHIFGRTTGNELDKPPSTGNACPFTYDASSDAKNNAA